MNIETLAIGSPLQGGFFAGLVLINAVKHAIAVAPKAEGELIDVWHPEYTDVPGATSCFDSVANTLAMAEAGSPLARAAIALRIGGYSDWVIGARDVVEITYRNLKPTAQPNLCSFRDGDNASAVPVTYPYTEAFPAQTPVQAFQAGGAEAFEPDWYITSTQFSRLHAFTQNFDYGYQVDLCKSFRARARAVRLIRL